MSVKKPRTPPEEYSSVGNPREEDNTVNRARAAREAADASQRDDDEDFFADPEVLPPRPKKERAEPKVAPVLARGQKTHRLDHRKLKKKQQDQVDLTWKGKNRGKAIDIFFKTKAEKARQKFGHSSVLIGDSTEGLVIGIPCPSLAFEYVIAQACFPLGLVIVLVARHGVGKSALVAEFGRWFHEAGGGMELVENETKFNPHWYKSILTPEVYDKMPLYRSTSLEDSQRKLTYGVSSAKHLMEGTLTDPGPGRTIPIMWAIDSLMGKQSEEVQEKILGKLGEDGKRGSKGEGAASRAHPVEALKITQYFKTIASEFDEWPFSLVLVNHLKSKTDDMGHELRSKAGGAHIDFQESFELELTKLGGHKKKIQCAEFEGVPLSISCEKNSFGPTHRRIQTRLLWWYEDDHTTPDGYVQRTSWDWDWSTVHLLDSLMNGENSIPMLKKNLKEMDFHLEVTSRGDMDNAAWSKSVGHKNKDHAVRWAELGAMIRADTELTNKLRHALRISHRPLLAGDYLAQLEEMTESLP